MGRALVMELQLVHAQGLDFGWGCKGQGTSGKQQLSSNPPTTAGQQRTTNSKEKHQTSSDQLTTVDLYSAGGHFVSSKGAGNNGKGEAVSGKGEGDIPKAAVSVVVRYKKFARIESGKGVGNSKSEAVGGKGKAVFKSNYDGQGEAVSSKGQDNSLGKAVSSKDKGEAVFGCKRDGQGETVSSKACKGGGGMVKGKGNNLQDGSRRCHDTDLCFLRLALTLLSAACVRSL